MDTYLQMNLEEHEMLSDGEEELNAVFEDDNEPFKTIESENKQSEEQPPVNTETTHGDQGKETVRMVISNLNMPPLEWNAQLLGIEWVTMHHDSIFETTREVIKIIQDTSAPKEIVLQVFQKWAGGVTREVFEREMTKVFEENRRVGMHKLQVATLYFIPEHSPVWPTIGEINCFIRKETLKDNMGPFNLHRFLMKPVGKGYTLYCKGMMWEEYRTDIGLGRTLSNEGLAKIKKFIIEQFKTGFLDIKLPSHQGVREVIPPPLYLTPGYKSNERMLEILINRGLAPVTCRERPASVAVDHVNEQLSRRGRPVPVRSVNRYDPLIVRLRSSFSHRAMMESDMASNVAGPSGVSSRSVSRTSMDEGVFMREDREEEKNYNMRDMQCQVDDLCYDVKRLREDRDKWRNRYERKDKESLEWKEQAHYNEDEMIELEQDLDNRKRTIEELENDLEASRYDNRELEDHVERLKADKEHLEGELTKVKGELARVTEQYDSLVSLYTGMDGSRMAKYISKGSGAMKKKFDEERKKKRQEKN